MSREFKIGDKVYFPKKSNKVFTLEDNKTNTFFPLIFGANSFTKEGRYHVNDITPSLFHATPENQTKLEALYGMEFEAPPHQPTSEEIIKAMLERGDKYVPCYVSRTYDPPNEGSYLDFIVCAHNDGRFYNQLRSGWKYATPFDPRTGQPITELPQ